MNIIRVRPRGYCKGVVSAINIAKETAIKNPNEKIYVLGMLVHNTYVTKALEKYNLITLDDSLKTREELLDEISDGIVIFTAHGVSAEVKRKALDKGLKIVDASCTDVVKTQNIINDYLLNGYEIIYIGKKGHPEAEAVQHGNINIHLIENINDLNHLKSFDKVFVTNQTTMSIDDISYIMSAIKEKYPDSIISEEICDATRKRQQAIKDLSNKNIDALFIVGDIKSNNSNRLAQIGREAGINRVLLINDVNDIDFKVLDGCENIAVSSGASTPTYLTNQVMDCLENNIKSKQNIDINKIF